MCILMGFIAGRDAMDACFNSAGAIQILTDYGPLLCMLFAVIAFTFGATNDGES